MAKPLSLYEGPTFCVMCGFRADRIELIGDLCNDCYNDWQEALEDFEEPDACSDHRSGCPRGAH